MALLEQPIQAALREDVEDVAVPLVSGVEPPLRHVGAGFFFFNAALCFLASRSASASEIFAISLFFETSGPFRKVRVSGEVAS